MDTTGARILVVDDDPASRRLLEVRLKALECHTLAAADGEEALAAIARSAPDLMLLDLQMPRLSGLELLQKLRSAGSTIPVIVITAHGSIDSAVEAMKAGAYDFIPKPFDPKHLEIVIGKALEQLSLKKNIEVLSEETGTRYDLVTGNSTVMKDVVDTARRAADSKATVLLLGESGTGKEIMARAIHKWSGRRTKPFVAINCVGLSRELLETELFGHERGAFTGAHQLKKGKMELGHGGTVFLDEIGDISSELQTKLLRFLQEREFERVGGNEPIRVDVRIIAATNRDLDAAVKEDRFREDLFHRLNVIAINLPPLRQRKQDILELAAHFLRRYGLESKKEITGIDEAAQEKLLAYDWPGNVRELANVIERAVVLGQPAKITVGDLPSRIVPAGSKGAVIGPLSFREAMDGYRKEIITAALARSKGNRAAAARALGLHEKYFLRVMKNMGIS